MDRDMRSLMAVPFDGYDTREYGKNGHTRGHILPDVIIRARKNDSQSMFLRMPAEILTVIIEILADSKSTLASLALVNSDCCYLARSRQFAMIHFDYSNPAQQLIAHLAKEIHRQTGVATRTFPIGIFVRGVTFASRPERVIASHQELYDSIFGDRATSCSPELRHKLLKEAGEHYVTLRNRLTSAITRTMPNLEALTWEDQFTMDEKFFRDISRCSAQHIKLKRVRIDKCWLIKRPLSPSPWPLRSLDLDVRLAHRFETDQVESRVIQEHISTEEMNNPVSDFFKTLFQSCAATLESLTWRRMGRWSNGSISIGPYPLRFPLLRYLRLGPILLSPLAFSSLLSSPLVHVEFPTSLGRLTGCLVTCEPLRNLQSLIIPMMPYQSQACNNVAEFIRRHKHVQKLLVHERDSHVRESTCLDRLVIPILAEGGFNNLRYLSLAWSGENISEMGRSHGNHIPDTALITLGTIVSLERLSLRAGRHIGWGNKWLVNHDKIRQHLKGLGRLKMLALVCDTYPISTFGHIKAEKYYDLRLVGDSEQKDAMAREDLDVDDVALIVDVSDAVENRQSESGLDEDERKIWEKAHRNRMLAQAEAYAAVFPALEWVLCGQRPMGFQGSFKKHNSPKKAIPLTQRRDECCKFLERTFGISQS